MKILKVLAVMAGVVLFGGAGLLVLFGDKLEQSVVTGGEGGAQIESALANPEGTELTVALRFDKLPAAGRPLDVSLDAQSVAMAPRTWTWAELAALDDAPDTSAATPPPLGRVLHVRLPIHLLPTTLVTKGRVPVIRLALNWGGTKQHGHEVSLDSLYSK